MTIEWRPDDSLSERNKKGQTKGALRASAALRRRKIRLGKGIITSRDPGMAAATRDLKRTGMPPGVESWQLPIPFFGLNWFWTCFDPFTVVPMHSHDHDSLRFVLSGELKFGRKTLKAGDWMFVPAGQAYSVRTGSLKVCVLYPHP
jgi:mannose-6-phosphate isomerase-like protein (cupin superfamily)